MVSALVGVSTHAFLQVHLYPIRIMLRSLPIGDNYDNNESLGLG